MVPDPPPPPPDEAMVIDPFTLLVTVTFEPAWM